MSDIAYTTIDPNETEIKHCYGSNVRIIYDPVSLGQLADLCEQSTIQPTINNLVRELYQFLIRTVVKKEFPTELITINTRMIESSSLGIWSGIVTKKQTKTVTVNMMRAGALPSQISFDFFNRLLDPKCNRQDHVVLSRTTNENKQVTGAELQGSKIGGDIQDSMLLFPDPMGATGSSISKIISYYKNNVYGVPHKIIAVHLIVTPEYLKKMSQDHPDVIVYALRLDRGASPKHVLKEMPGKLWDEESGLDKNQYILPGGGGFGEIINNSFC